MIPGDYRFIFAISTISSVFVYDTQHIHPIAKFSGLHYAAINDLSWSEDGTILTACSSDGYLSFFRFPLGTLGVRLDNDQVPELIRKARPCLFDYVSSCYDVVNAELFAANANTGVKESTDKQLNEDRYPIVTTDTDPTDEAPTIITNEPATVIPDEAATITTDESATIITDIPATIITHDVTTIILDDASITITGEASVTISPNALFHEDPALGIRDSTVENVPLAMMGDTSRSHDIAAAVTIISSTVEEKKRKRIQPTLITSLIGSSSSGSNVAVPLQESEDCLKNILNYSDKESHRTMEHILSSPVHDENINSVNHAHTGCGEHVDIGSDPEEVLNSVCPSTSKGDDEGGSELTDSQRKRKRITPTLIATYTGSSSTCALAATASSGTVSKIIQAHHVV